MLEKIEPVGLTARAAEEVRKIMQTKNIPPEYGLRVGIRGGGGCGGVALMIGFDKAKPTDLTYTLQGITLHIDKKHTMYLIGKQIDFYEGADAKGFMFAEQK
ncbi:MAG TPA: iron-sulfur cluster biosynthesis family protein [Cyclobacteriaceae bacterium]|jgi:iron-sulfur cluster assembly protein|nr:iron-sulfur cluster assembly accessory protein [Cytophagales bacterium]HNT49902.1 iron-sulfur cluster biosynthesis family protein [Cyclobacteriaceae bacterium]HRE67311.1 iron-sulfur cluster biosynthesis family protein [Cyclobacteriaceae bacterium]HRF33081.1 iron-sulfur cluster biosynthesis family protein [Cyclobacteriaceae bacterium]